MARKPTFPKAKKIVIRKTKTLKQKMIRLKMIKPKEPKALDVSSMIKKLRIY